jgi:hypothetical protein
VIFGCSEEAGAVTVEVIVISLIPRCHKGMDEETCLMWKWSDICSCMPEIHVKHKVHVCSDSVTHDWSSNLVHNVRPNGFPNRYHSGS